MGEVFSDTINTGIYILEPEILDLILKNRNATSVRIFFQHFSSRISDSTVMLQKGTGKISASVNEYQDAHMDTLRGDVHLHIEGNKRENIIVGDGTTVETDPRNLTGMTILGKTAGSIMALS